MMEATDFGAANSILILVGLAVFAIALYAWWRWRK